MSSFAFYREQARLQTELAVEAVLPLVRERCLRAAGAWIDLAERAQKTEHARQIRIEAQMSRAETTPIPYP